MSTRMYLLPAEDGAEADELDGSTMDISMIPGVSVGMEVGDGIGEGVMVGMGVYVGLAISASMNWGTGVISGCPAF